MDELGSDARTIDSVFTRYGIGARVSRVPYTSFQSSAWNVFALERRKDTKVRDVVKLADEIDEALTENRMKPTQCRFDTLPLRAMTPRRKPETTDVLRVLQQLAPKVRGRGQLVTLLGEVIKTDRALPSVVDLAQPTTPHMLIAGTTGSGKTTLLVGLVASLSILNDTRRLRLHVLDPKGVDLHVLDGLPGMAHAVVRDAETSVDVLRDIVAEMDRRKARGVADPDNRIVVVIDEMADLIDVAGDDVVRSIQRLLQAGRGLGIHVIGATQKPLSSVVGSLAKANFPLRMVGRVMSKSDANTAAGIADTGAERLPGLGAFVKVTSAVESVQAYTMDKARIAALGGRVPPQQYQPTNGTSTSVTTPILPVDTGIDTAVDTTRRLAFNVYGQPTPDEARIIRAMLRNGISKNRIIAEILPNANRNKCFDFINAATQRQEVNA